MLHIYIARHGQNEDNANGILNGHRDLPLTATGREQARDLAFGVKCLGIKFDAVYTSPLCRAYDTAVEVTNALKLSAPVTLGTLIERDFGVMTGVPTSMIGHMCAPDIIKTDTITYFLSPKGAETFPELVERAKKSLMELRARHTSGSILLVTHGDIGKMIYAAHYDLPWREPLTMFHFGNCELLHLTPDKRHGDTRLIRIPQHNH